MSVVLARDNNLLLLLLEHDAGDVCHSVCLSVSLDFAVPDMNHAKRTIKAYSPAAKTQTVVETSAVNVNAAKTV